MACSLSLAAICFLFLVTAVEARTCVTLTVTCQKSGWVELHVYTVECVHNVLLSVVGLLL